MFLGMARSNSNLKSCEKYKREEMGESGWSSTYSKAFASKWYANRKSVRIETMKVTMIENFLV
jgi:hypothetical protein